MEKIIKYKGLTLDSFQIQAINEIEKGHSLVLSAPTGSGKTLIAEYLIEKVLETDKRIIYTSPVKALSNQKFRDFSKLYGDKIGILTGDVVINRDAQALIVTTEVYRNMAMEDPEAIADISYVIFDEIHYLGDIERGTVWEESIIFSPHTVRFLALSATIPNCKELALWIESVIKHKVSVISHNERAVPLTHLFYHNKKLMTFKDFRKKANIKSEKPLSYRYKNQLKKDDESKHFHIIDELRKLDRLPLLYFVFSRASADKMSKKSAEYFNFTTKEEKVLIEQMVDECIEKYHLDNLETAHSLKAELMQGVGRHHAGLLPQLKEVIEILFAKRILKVLFVTETFAVGVNMPARSVAYDALKKYDGRSFRPMKGIEFTQISGRAGRRGIDETGWVVVPHNTRDLSFEELQNLVYGDIEILESQFDLSFNSVLNLYAGHKIDEVRKILKRNFAQFQANKKLPYIADQVAKFRSELEQSGHVCTEEKNDIHEFMKFNRKRQETLNAMTKQMSSIKGGMRGRKNKRYQTKVKKDFAEMSKFLKDKEKDYICGNCRNKGRCVSTFNQSLRLQKKLDYWKDLLEGQEELQLPLYENKLETLRELGYIDDDGLLPRGEVACRIHTKEIAVTELFLHGYFHECDEHEINALVFSLMYEYRKRGAQNQQRQSVRISSKLRSAKGFINSLARQYPFVEPLEMRLTDLVIQWSKGEDFEKIMAMTDVPEGDLIRAFRNTIDLLRQIREAVKDQSLRSKLLKCLGCINREIVLATELRS